MRPKGLSLWWAEGNQKFKEGDQVRIEASDMGTATTIKQVHSGP